MRLSLTHMVAVHLVPSHAPHVPHPYGRGPLGALDDGAARVTGHRVVRPVRFDRVEEHRVAHLGLKGHVSARTLGEGAHSLWVGRW